MNLLRRLTQFFRRSWLFRLLLWGCGAVLVLIVLMVLLLELWLIPRAIPTMRHELALLGVHLSQEDPDVDLLRGSVVLEDVTFFRSAAKKEPVMFVSDFGVRINWRQLVLEGTLWGEATIRDGRIVFYDDRGDTEFDEIKADMEISEDGMRIARLTSRALGHRLSGTGFARWADVGENEEEIEEEADGEPGAAGGYPDLDISLRWMHTVSRLLRVVPSGEEEGTLDLNFVWDPARPRRFREDGSPIPYPALEVSGVLAMKEGRWLGLGLDSLEAKVVFRDWVVEVSSLTAQGYGGSAVSAGHYDLATDLLKVSRWESDLDAIEKVKKRVKKGSVLEA